MTNQSRRITLDPIGEYGGTYAMVDADGQETWISDGNSLVKTDAQRVSDALDALQEGEPRYLSEYRKTKKPVYVDTVSDAVWFEEVHRSLFRSETVRVRVSEEGVGRLLDKMREIAG